MTPRRQDSECVTAQSLALFNQSCQPINTMLKSSDISRYALYGEGNPAITPEFVHIETISSRSSQHEWTISPHTHPGIFQFLLLEHGSGELLGDVVSEAGGVPLQPSTLVMLPSGSVHAFRFAEDAQGWVLSVADTLLADRRLEPFLTAGGLTAMHTGNGVRHRQLSPGNGQSRRLGWIMADVSRAIIEGGANPLPAPLVAELALVLTLAAEVLADLDGDTPRRTGPDALVARFRRLVDVRFRDSCTVDAYARELATSAPTLTRACRAVLDRAPGEVVQERLLLEAMRLLTYTGRSIAHIAQSLGFEDPAYFARFFKSRTGTTASAFRAAGGWIGTSR
jgi:AraC family transcriptional activator of pobA